MKKLLSTLLMAILLCGCFALGASAARYTPIVVDDDPTTLEDMARYDAMRDKIREFHIANNITDKYLYYLATTSTYEYTQYGREINGKCDAAILKANNEYDATQDYKAFNAAVLEAYRQLYVAEFDGYRIYLNVSVPDEIWIFYGEDPAAHVSPAPQAWWRKLPAFLQWILRYILFGWLWMK